MSASPSPPLSDLPAYEEATTTIRKEKVTASAVVRECNSAGCRFTVVLVLVALTTILVVAHFTANTTKLATFSAEARRHWKEDLEGQKEAQEQTKKQ